METLYNQTNNLSGLNTFKVFQKRLYSKQLVRQKSNKKKGVYLSIDTQLLPDTLLNLTQQIQPSGKNLFCDIFTLIHEMDFQFPCIRIATNRLVMIKTIPTFMWVH